MTGLYTAVTRGKPLIGSNNRRAKSLWCVRVTERYAEDNWFRIVFSGESRLNFAFNGGRVAVWHDAATEIEQETSQQLPADVLFL